MVYLEDIKHVGILGMRWGHRKKEDSGKRSSLFNPKASHDDISNEILKQNPHAAVLKPQSKKKITEKEIEARRARNKKIAIGVGVGITIAAGTVLYIKNKDKVDAAVKSFLKKETIDPANLLPNKDAHQFKSVGIRAKTKQEGVAANWVASWFSHDVHRYDGITQEAYDKLDDTDVIVKPGTIFGRVTKAKNEVLRPGAYASFGEEDINRYKLFMPALWNHNGIGSKNTYSMTMEATTEIKSPSAKKRVDMFTKLLKEDSKFYESIFPSWTKEPEEDIPELSRSLYNQFTAGVLLNKDHEAGKIYKNTFLKQGYNAIVDDNDAGRLSKTPMILLDPKSMVVKGIKKITREDEISALANLKPLAGENTTEIVGKIRNELGVFVPNINFILDEMKY